MSTLADLLEGRREEIIRRWTDQVREGLAPGPRSEAELRDHIPEYLKELTAALRRNLSATPPPPHSTTEVAKEHGLQRFRVGFSLEALAREYGVLRNLILDLVKESAAQVTFDEVRALADYISDAIAEGVAEYTHQREQLERAAEEAMRQRDAQLAAILRSIGDAVIATDIDGRVTFMNAVAEALTGWPQAEARGRPLDEVFHILNEHTRARAENLVDQVLRHRVAVGLGSRAVLVRRHGAEVPIDDIAAPIHSDNGAPSGVVVVFRDVTEARHKNAELRVFRALIEANRDFIALARPDGQLDYMNPAGRQLLEVDSLEEACLLNAADIFTKESSAQTMSAIFPPVLSGDYYRSEATFRSFQTGEAIPVLQDTFAVRSPRGQVLAVAMIGRDKRDQNRIEAERERLLHETEEARAEEAQARERLEAEVEARQRVEARLLRVLDVGEVGSWDLDLSTQEVMADARCRAMYGFTPDEPFLASKAMATFHVDERERIEQAVADAIAGKDGGRYHVEHRVVFPRSGATRWVSARGQAYFDAKGRALRFLGTSVDITVRKEAELAREGLLEALASQPSLHVGVLEGPDLVFKMVNALYQEEIGLGREILGKPLSDAMPELIPQGFGARLLKVMETGEPVIGREGRAALARPDGTLHDVFFNYVYQPVRGPSGRFESVLSLSHDVTDVVLAREQALRVAMEEKARADFEQQLIGIVSHDLRNPLGAILLGTSILLRHDGLDERSMKIVKRIHNSTERATHLVKDILDFTQARLGGGLPVRRTPVDVHSVTRQIVDELQVNFPERTIVIDAEGDGIGSLDGERVAQVLTNLASNALKYGHPDMAVTVRTCGYADAVTIEVHNEGAPIPEEKIAHLFEPLQRGTTQADKLGRSVGLGLYIVKHIVEAHGGTIQVTSSEEAGTTFRVKLPRR